MAKKYEFKPDRPGSGLLEKLYLTRQQRRALLKWLLYTLVLLVLSVVQDVVLCQTRIFGATTELVPCGIFLICVMVGVESGCVFSLVAAFLYLFSGTAAGYYCVVFLTGLAVAVTLLRQSYLRRSFGSTMLCVVAAMLVYELLVFAFGLFLGLTTFARLGGFLITTLFSLMAAPVLYPVVKAIGNVGGELWKE